MVNTLAESEDLLVSLGIDHLVDEGDPPVQPVDHGQLVQDPS